jgi:hypothetical protein
MGKRRAESIIQWRMISALSHATTLDTEEQAPYPWKTAKRVCAMLRIVIRRDRIPADRGPGRNW